MKAKNLALWAGIALSEFTADLIVGRQTRTCPKAYMPNIECSSLMRMLPLRPATGRAANVCAIGINSRSLVAHLVLHSTPGLLHQRCNRFAHIPTQVNRSKKFAVGSRIFSIFSLQNQSVRILVTSGTLFKPQWLPVFSPRPCERPGQRRACSPGGRSRHDA